MEPSCFTSSIADLCGDVREKCEELREAKMGLRMRLIEIIKKEIGGAGFEIYAGDNLVPEACRQAGRMILFIEAKQ